MNLSFLSDPDFVPVCRRSLQERQHWLETSYKPFLQEIDATMTEIKRKTEAGFRVEDRAPPQEEIRGLLAACNFLTANWYGIPNISVLWEAMFEIMTIAGMETVYRYEDVPKKTSLDGWILGMDGAVRSKAYQVADGWYAELMSRGSVSQKTGSNDIENTLLPTVYKTEDAKIVLGGEISKHFVVKSMAAVQKSILQRLSDNGVSFFQLPTYEVRKRLSSLTPEEIKLHNIDVEGSAFQFLLQHGRWIENVGQLTPDTQKTLNVYLTEQIKANNTSPTTPPTLKVDEPLFNLGVGIQAQDPVEPIRRCTSTEPTHPLLRGRNTESIKPPTKPSNRSTSQENRASADAAFEEFSKWLRQHPGEYYHGDEQEHRRLLILGIWNGKLSVVKRQVVDSLTLHRYVSIHWWRWFPLYTVQPDNNVKETRHSGVREHSRIRKNAFVYAESHGIGLLSGGVSNKVFDEAEEEVSNSVLKAATSSATFSGDYVQRLLKSRGQDIISQGAQLLWEVGGWLDPGAKVGNWWTTDIEKIVVECMNLSPPFAESSGLLLPRETYHCTGQNPKIGSSIGATLHTHIERGRLQDFPVFSLTNSPQYITEYNCTMDLVQVSDNPDSWYLKCSTVACLNAVTDGPVGLLIALRRHVIETLGGRDVDFVVKALPDAEKGGIAIIFIVTGKLIEIKGKGCVNEFTGEDTFGPEFPVTNFDLSISGGRIIVKEDFRWNAAMEGRPALERLYTWMRCPGSRDVVTNFLRNQVNFIDPPRIRTL